MALNQKNLRYYYWLIKGFITKNARLILLSFFLSIITVVSLISISPYLVNFIFLKKDVIGIVGTFELKDIPDEILSKISNGLVFINEKGEIVPIVAESWQMINNGTEYRFHLRKNLVWNDGKPITAHDINYNFKDVQTQVIDNYTIAFKLKKPLPIFPSYVTKPIIRYPLVGIAGLYKVEHIKAKYGIIEEISLTPQKVGLDNLVYRFYDSETKVLDAYKLGEINQMDITKRSLIDSISNWNNTVVTKNVDYSRLLTLFFDMDNQMLAEDKDLRHAIIEAISPQKLAEFGELATGPIPPLSWAYNTDLKKTQYDPEQAAKIFKKYFEASNSAELRLNTYYDYTEMSDLIKSELESQGMKIKENILSTGEPRPFDLFLAYWKVPVDPDQYYFWHSTQKVGNITDYKSPKIDKLLEDGRSTLSVAERKKIYTDFQKVILDDSPADFILYPYTYTVKRK